MSERESAQEIEEAAAGWAVRADAGTLDAAAWAELKAWLAGDPRRRGAYLRARAGLRYLDQGRAEQDVAPEAPARRRYWLPFAAGGAGAAAIAAAVAFYLATPLELTSDVGEVRRVALSDGSTATLNTDSDIDVALTGPERRITVERGEAWFEVARDQRHPFVVSAGAARVRATGTAFAVRRQGEGADVVVSEGTVLAWIDGAGRAPVRVTAGQRTALRPRAAAAPAVEVVKPGDALAWREGGISLSGESIAAAAAEFNRYNRLRIEVADPSIGDQPVVGYFKSTRPDQFAEAAAEMSGAVARRDGDRIILSRR